MENNTEKKLLGIYWHSEDIIYTMVSNRKILLVASILPITIGYLHSYLEEHAFQVESLVLNKTIHFHAQSFDPDAARQELLQCSIQGKHKRLAKLIIQELGGLSVLRLLTAQMLAVVFNKLLSLNLCVLTDIGYDKEVGYYNNLGKKTGANKRILQLAFPRTLRYVQDNNFFELNEAILRFDPGIICLQVTSHAVFKITASLIEKIHEKYPGVRIVIVGPFATNAYKAILSIYPLVIVVRGEAEETMLELTAALFAKDDLYAVKGIAFSNAGSVVETLERPLIIDLDKLPFPKQIVFKDTSAAILTARGCPFNCSFCCLDANSRNRIRYRSIENVMRELEYIRENYPEQKSVFILDDTFLLNRKRVIAFCNEVIKRELKFDFSCQGRVRPLSADVVKKLVQAGFSQVHFGFESGNDAILRQAHKLITKNDMLRAIRLFANTNILVRAYLIVGLPGETWQTIKETGLFMQKLQKIKYIRFWPLGIALVHPNTELFEKMKEAKLMDEYSWVNHKEQIFFYTREHSEQELCRMEEELASYIYLDRFFSVKGFFRQWHVVLFFSRE